MSCLCACFEGIISMVQSVHVTSWNYSFPVHPATHLVGKHICKYSKENNIKQSNMRCAETWLARNQLHKLGTRQTNWHRIVLICSTIMNSVVLMLYISLHCCTLFQPHSLWCFFSCWVVTNNMRTELRRTLSLPGKTCRWWPSSQVFR